MALNIFGKEWKLDAGKTTFTSTFKPNQETRKYDELQNGYTLTVKGTNQGKPYQWSYTAYYDGKPHAVTGRDDVDSIIIYTYGNGLTGGWFLKDGKTVAAYQRGGSLALEVTAGGLRPDGSVYFDTIQYS